eukprot:15367213-Ditylum_brightwellii.AAC.1
MVIQVINVIGDVTFVLPKVSETSIKVESLEVEGYIKGKVPNTKLIVHRTRVPDIISCENDIWGR